MARSGASKGRARAWASAVSDFTDAIRIDRNDFDLWHDRGRANAELGRWDDAVSDWEQAIALKPDDWSTLCFLGIASAGQGKYEKAVESYSTGINYGAMAGRRLRAGLLPFKAWSCGRR